MCICQYKETWVLSDIPVKMADFNPFLGLGKEVDSKLNVIHDSLNFLKTSKHVS